MSSEDTLKAGGAEGQDDIPDDAPVPIPDKPLTSFVIPVGEHETATVDPKIAALSTLEKLSHKDWKVIQMGCNEVEETMNTRPEQSDDFFESVSKALQSLLKKPQAMVQEGSICALKALLPHCPIKFVEDTETIAATCKILCEKGLSGRTKAHDATEAVLGFLTEMGRGAEVSAALFNASASKVTKVSTSAIVAFGKLLADFGPQPFDLKDLGAMAPKWFTYRDQAARRGAATILVAICGYVGKDSMQPFVTSLSPIHQKEMQELFSKEPPPPKVPPRHLRESTGASSSAGDNADFSLPLPEQAGQNQVVNILKLVNSKWYAKLKSSNWKGKVQMIEELINASDGKVLEKGEYGELVNALKGQLKDSTVYVVRVSVIMLGKLASGLRESFASTAKHLTPLLVAKFKDKNKPLQAAVLAALSAFTSACFPITDVAQDVTEGLESKVASESQCTLMWIAAAAQTTSKKFLSILTHNVETLFKWCIKGFEHDQVVCRKEAGNTLAAVASMDNESVLMLFKTLDQNTAKKVKSNTSIELQGFFAGKTSRFSLGAGQQSNPTSLSQGNAKKSFFNPNATINPGSTFNPSATIKPGGSFNPNATINPGSSSASSFSTFASSAVPSKMPAFNPNATISAGSAGVRTSVFDQSQTLSSSRIVKLSLKPGGGVSTARRNVFNPGATISAGGSSSTLMKSSLLSPTMRAVPFDPSNPNATQQHADMSGASRVKAEAQVKTDLSASVPRSVLDALDDPILKTRQDAMTEFSNIIKHLGTISAELGDIPELLIRRFADKNRTAQKNAISLCVSIANAMGTPFGKYLGVFLPNLFTLLGDISGDLRECTLNALKSIVKIDGLPLDPVASMLAKFMTETHSSPGKDKAVELLLFLASLPGWNGKHDLDEIKPLAKPLLIFATDRSATLKQHAEKALGEVIKLVGVQFAEETVLNDGDFKLAAKQQLVQLLASHGGASVVKSLAHHALDPVSGAVPPPKTDATGSAQAALAPKRKSEAVAETEPPQKRLAVEPLRPVTAPLEDDGGKSKRQQENSAEPWSVNSVNVPQKSLKRLYGYLCRCVSSEIAAMASSESVGTRFSASKQLISRVGACEDAVPGVSDVLFMVSTTLLGATDQITVQAGFNLAESVVGVLEKKASMLSDYDAGLILPLLLQKPMKFFSERAHALLARVRKIYPTSKLFNQVLTLLAEGEWSALNEAELTECLNELSAMLGKQGTTVCDDIARTVKVLSSFIFSRSVSARAAALVSCSWLVAHGGAAITKRLADAGVPADLLARLKSGDYISHQKEHRESVEPAQRKPKEKPKPEQKVVAQEALSIGSAAQRFLELAKLFDGFLSTCSSGSAPDEAAVTAELKRLAELIPSASKLAGLHVPPELVVALSRLLASLVNRAPSKSVERRLAAHVAQVLATLVQSAVGAIEALDAEPLKELIAGVAQSVVVLKIEFDDGVLLSTTRDSTERLRVALPMLYQLLLEKSTTLVALTSLTYAIKDVIVQDMSKPLPFETSLYLCQSLYQKHLGMTQDDVMASIGLRAPLEALHLLLVTVQEKSISQPQPRLEQSLRSVLKSVLTLIHHLVSLKGDTIRINMSFLRAPPYSTQPQMLKKIVDKFLATADAAQVHTPTVSRTGSAIALEKISEKLRNVSDTTLTAKPASMVSTPSNLTIDQLRERLARLSK